MQQVAVSQQDLLLSIVFFLLQDKWVFWTGLCVTVTVMVLVVMYFA